MPRKGNKKTKCEDKKRLKKTKEKLYIVPESKNLQPNVGVVGKHIDVQPSWNFEQDQTPKCRKRMCFGDLEEGDYVHI